MKRNHKLLICFVLAVVMLPITNVLGQDSNNVKPNQTIGPEKGTLIITGDGIYGVFQDKFLELIGGADAPIIVIPTAGSSEVLSDEFLEKYKQKFIKSGFNNVTVLHTRDPQEANTDEFIEAFDTIDSDGTGRIPLSVVKHILEGIAENVSFDMVDCLLEEIDKDDDGLVSMDDLKRFLALEQFPSKVKFVEGKEELYEEEEVPEQPASLRVTAKVHEV